MATKKAVVKNSRAKKNSPVLPGLQAELNLMMKNGLQDALSGWNPLGYGTPLDQTTTVFQNNRWYLISNMRQLLCEIYVEHGLIQTIVDVPVDDGFRGGVEVISGQLTPEQLEQLKNVMDREDDLGVVAQAMKWNRLFGGAGVLIMSDQDPISELDINAIGPDTKLVFRAVDMWELFWDKQNAEGFDAEIQEEEYEYYNYYAKQVHKTRVLKLKGLTAPSFIRPRLRGWGFSIVESLVRSLNQYLKANNLAFEVLDEFKVDVYKLKNLVNTLMNPNGEVLVRQRVALANQQKNYQHALVMDSEDDFGQKELSFTGLAETMVQIRMQIACDLRMPLTKIFGISAAGFSSGEDDIENYNAMIESQIRQKAKYHILKIVQLRCQQQFSYIPDDLNLEFPPLRILSAEQEENVKTQIFNRLISAKTAGEISIKEFRDSCNKAHLVPVHLDTDDATLSDIESEAQEKADEIGDGANTEDSEKMAPLKKAPKSETQPKEAKE